MIPAHAIDASGMLLLLVNAALRTLVVAAVAGLGLAVFRVKATSARLLTWTAVLYARLVDSASVMAAAIHTGSAAGLDADCRHCRASSASDRQASLMPHVNQEPQKQSLAGRGRLSPRIPAGIPALPTMTHPSIASPYGLTFRLSWTSIATAIYLAVALVLLLRFRSASGHAAAGQKSEALTDHVCD